MAERPYIAANMVWQFPFSPRHRVQIGSHQNCTCYGGLRCRHLTTVIDRIWQLEDVDGAKRYTGFVNTNNMGPLPCGICFERDGWGYRGGNFIFCICCYRAFHRSCLFEWLKRKGDNAFCPHCRTADFLPGNHGFRLPESADKGGEGDGQQPLDDLAKHKDEHDDMEVVEDDCCVASAEAPRIERSQQQGSRPHLDLVAATKELAFLQKLREEAVRGPAMLKLAQQQLDLPENLADDVKDLLELTPGWADYGGGTDTIDDKTFDVSSILLAAFSLVGRWPDFIIPSPKQTINFKFGADTLIVDGTSTLRLFRTKATPPHVVRDSASEVLPLLAITLPESITSALAFIQE